MKGDTTRNSKRTAEPVSSADVQWLDPQEIKSWMAVMALIEVLPAALDAQLRRDAGVNSYEYLVLVSLSEAPDRTMGMSQLAGRAVGSLSRLSHAVNRLEAKGWVARSPGASGRVVEVTMTEEGWVTMQRIAPGHVAEARRLVVDVLGPTRLATMGRHCRAILDAIDPKYTAMIDEAAG